MDRPPVGQEPEDHVDPAQVIASKGYAEGKPPVQAELEPLPDEIYEERGRILEMVKFISGIGDIGVGEKPEGVTSGRGFLVLQEAVDSIIMPTLLAFENCKEEVARRMLVLAQRYYTEERTIRVKGERGKWTVKPFKGSDLIEGLDVRVVTGSSFPWSKSARTDVVLSILQSLPELANNDQGIPDAGKVARMLEQGGVGVFEAENDPDTQEVEREHGLFEAFNPDEGIMALPQLGFWQNHAKHLEMHYRFVKTSYMRIADWHPMAQLAFKEHLLATAAAFSESSSRSCLAKRRAASKTGRWRRQQQTDRERQGRTQHTRELWSQATEGRPAGDSRRPSRGGADRRTKKKKKRTTRMIPTRSSRRPRTAPSCRPRSRTCLRKSDRSFKSA
jgi:hypothetical protein